MAVLITRQEASKDSKASETQKFSEHKVTIVNRKSLQATGILQVNTTSENLIAVNTVNGELNIFGRNIRILKISLEEGILNAEGIFVELKYTEKKEKQSLFKKIFK